LKLILELEDKLKRIEGTFERDEILEIRFIMKILYNNFIIIYTSLFVFFKFFQLIFFNEYKIEIQIVKTGYEK